MFSRPPTTPSPLTETGLRGRPAASGTSGHQDSCSNILRGSSASVKRPPSAQRSSPPRRARPASGADTTYWPAVRPAQHQPVRGPLWPAARVQPGQRHRGRPGAPEDPGPRRGQGQTPRRRLRHRRPVQGPRRGGAGRGPQPPLHPPAPSASSPAAHPRPRDLPLALSVAPAFLGISAPHTRPSAVCPRPSRRIAQRGAQGRWRRKGRLRLRTRRAAVAPTRASAPPRAPPSGRREQDSLLLRTCTCLSVRESLQEAEVGSGAPPLSRPKHTAGGKLVPPWPSVSRGKKRRQ